MVASKEGDHVICEAVNNDGPLEHAELIALSEAMRKLNKKRLNDYVLFTNLEPCPMCAYAISKCNIDTLYFGAEDVKGGGVINGLEFHSVKICSNQTSFLVYLKKNQLNCLNLSLKLRDSALTAIIASMHLLI